MSEQLVKILHENGLESGPKAEYLTEKFSEYFAIAEEWTERAKSIVVTDETQTVQMELARTGRRFIQKKRIAIEEARKLMKADVLAEGRAIDGVAKALTALLSPIEEHLDRQEHFVELKKKAEHEARQREIERRMEEERIAQEKAEEEERKRIRIENERLRKEAEERERVLAAEREKAEAERKEAERKLAEERRKADEEKRRIEEAARKEREAAELKARQAREKAEAERRAIEEKARKERELLEAAAKKEREEADAKRKAIEERARAEHERAERERKELEARLASMITCPKCGHKFEPIA